MYKTYGVAMKKGGQGKSTTVITLARLLALYGARVLVIDLAMPGTTSTSFRDCWPASDHGVFSELLAPFCQLSADEIPHPDDTIMAYDTQMLPVPLVSKPSWGGGLVSLLPFDDGLGNIARNMKSPLVLDGFLRSVDSAFDIMLIDCPSDDSILLDNSMFAMDRMLIPFTPSAASLEGLDATLRLLRRFREGTARLTLGGVILTQVEPRNKRTSDLVNTLIHSGIVEGEPIKERLFPFAIRASDYYDHAFRYGEPVWERTKEVRVWAGYVLMSEWLLLDAGLDHLCVNRRHAALVEPNTRVLDTNAVATGVGSGEALFRDIREMFAPGQME